MGTHAGLTPSPQGRDVLNRVSVFLVYMKSPLDWGHRKLTIACCAVWEDVPHVWNQ